MKRSAQQKLFINTVSCILRAGIVAIQDS